MDTPVILETVQLLEKLANIIYYQEAEAIYNIKFKSGPELDQYLADCKANKDSIIRLLADGVELKSKFDKDQTRSPIAQDIFSYILYSANSALQTVRNYNVRTDYLSKIKDHVQSLIKELEEMDTGNATDVQNLADEALQYKNAMFQFVSKYQSNASLSFSQNLKDQGVTFDELVQSHMHIMGLGGLFENLEDTKKIMVYGHIIEASGRGSIVLDSLLKLKAVGGLAAILLTAGLMVWDIFSSSHVIQTTVHDAVVSVASFGGAMLGDVIGTAMATGLLELEETSVFVMMAGFATGIAGAFILGAFAGALLGFIIGSGGDAPPSTDGYHCYVAPMPDGVVLARQISH